MGDTHMRPTSGTRKSQSLSALLTILAVLTLTAACTATPAVSGPAIASPSADPSTPATASASVTASPMVTVSASPSPDLLDSTTEQSTQAPAGAIQIEMHGPPPVFLPPALSATAGEVVFFLKNTSPRGDPTGHGSHSLAIGPSVGDPVAVSELVRPGASAVFTVQGLEAGEYAIWCTFLDHADLGQVGTLTVT